jgi:hypothetical protein
VLLLISPSDFSSAWAGLGAVKDLAENEVQGGVHTKALTATYCFSSRSKRASIAMKVRNDHTASVAAYVSNSDLACWSPHTTRVTELYISTDGHACQIYRRLRPGSTGIIS